MYTEWKKLGPLKGLLIGALNVVLELEVMLNVGDFGVV